MSNSVTNTVGERYFLKAQRIEEPRRRFLQEFDLLSFYAEHRYNRYFAGWTLKKLCNAKPEEAAACAQIVYKIHLMYRDCYNGKSEVINDFARHCDAGDYQKALASIRNANREGRL